MDWIRFLDENNIHYVTRGPNTKRGEISVHCPFCADEDPSEHLGISLKTENWGCLRDSSHRGKSSRTLVKNILACSSVQAGLIVKQYSKADPDTLEAALMVLQADTAGATFHEEDLTRQARRQKLGPQFNDFSRIRPRGITKKFFTYLQSRGYENPQDVIDVYDLKCGLTGKYQDRVIIPVRHCGELLGWTSRALGKRLSAPRYLESSEDIKTTVFNFDEISKGGKRLFIVEGPFDAIKVDSFGAIADVPYRATCTFGTSFTVSQIALLRALTHKFDEIYIMFDKGAEHPAGELSQWIDRPTIFCPVDDPGELKERHLYDMGDTDFRKKGFRHKYYEGYNISAIHKWP